MHKQLITVQDKMSKKNDYKNRNEIELVESMENLIRCQYQRNV